MAWTYLAESADSPSPFSLGYPLSPTVRSTNTQGPCSLRAKPMVACHGLQSGMMFGHCEVPCFPEWTSSMAVSRARTSALRAMERAWQESAQDWFSRCSGLSAKPAPRSSFWKMSLPLGLVVENEWARNWPRSGMIVDGMCYPLTTWERRTRENAGSYWPTATATDSKGSRNATVKDRKVAGHSGVTLTDFVTLFPTPTTRNTVRSAKFREGRTLSPREQTGGQLNPTWVEWLMGYPSEWTACADWAMPSSRRKRAKRSAG